LINYTLAYTVNGRCRFEGRRWDCKVNTSNSWQIDVTGPGSNLPAYNYNGQIKLPYAFVDSVTREVQYATWLFFKTPFHVLSINMNKLGATSTFIVEVDDIPAATVFTGELNINRSRKRSVLEALKNNLIKQSSTYNTSIGFVNSNRSNYESDSNRIKFLNSEILSKTNSLTSSIAERNNLQIENNKLQPSVANKLAHKDQVNKLQSECRNEALSVGDVLKTYEKYNREFNADEVAQFLDKEYSNLCLFHLAAQDLTLMIPNQVKEINNARKEVSKNRNISTVRDLFNSDEFFILKDFN
jgi:regulator of replication initiation timing